MLQSSGWFGARRAWITLAAAVALIAGALPGTAEARGADGGAEAQTLAALEEFSQGDPDVAMYCTDARQMIKLFTTLGSRLGTPMSSEFERLLAPGSPISFALWKDGRRGRMRLQSVVPMETLVIGMQRSATVIATGDGMLQTQSPSGVQTWRQVGEAIEVVDEGLELKGEGWDLASLAATGQGALGRPGCVIAINMTRMPKRSIPGGYLLLHIPADAAKGMFFAMTSPEAAKLTDLPRPALPDLDLYAPAPPDVLLVLGVALRDLEIDALIDEENAAAWRRLQRRMPAAGMVVAVSRTDGRPGLSAAIPMERQIGAWWLMRRLRSLLDKTDVVYEEISRTEIRIRSPKGELLVTAERGRLLISSDAGQMAAMALKRGEPWISGRAAELAAEYPLVLSANALPIPGATAPLDMPITLALGVSDGVLHGFITAPPNLLTMAPLLKGLLKSPLPQSLPR